METDAIVLDTRDQGESDLIVTLYTRDSGRISAIAKGAKKSKRRFVNKLEPFSFLLIDYSHRNKNGLAFLAEAELHTAFIRLRNSNTLYIFASIIRETLLAGIRDGEPDDKIYRLILWSLHHLNEGHPPTNVLALFLLRFYDHLGYRPNLGQCSECSQPYSTTNRYGFDLAAGGLRCRYCPPNAFTTPLGHGTIRLLSSAQNQPLERLTRLKINPSMAQEALQFLARYGRQLLQRDINSWQSLRQLNSLNATPRRDSPVH